MIRNNVVVQLRGGLGNQLFGLFAGLRLAEQNNCVLVLDGRLIKFGSNPSRRLEINLIDLSEIRIPVKMLSEVSIPTSRIGRKLFRPFIGKIATFVKRESPSQVISELDDLETCQIDGDVLLDGYFSTFKHFESWLGNNPSFKFQPRNTSEMFRQSAKELISSTGLHIRLGDYLNHPDVYPIPASRYYEEAIKILDCQHNYVVFCEEYDEAIRFFPSILQNAKSVITQKDFSSVETLSLMATCRSLIAANSSFSQWAGQFIKSRGGAVVSPSQFTLESLVNVDEKNWIKLDIKDGSQVQ